MNLYKLARIVNTANALTNPKRLPHRVKNIILGRMLARAGVWRWLWR
jgi:hypothetical protein